jgi:hypothetical protein
LNSRGFDIDTVRAVHSEIRWHPRCSQDAARFDDHMRRMLLGVVALVMVATVPCVASAQRLQIHTGALAGTGVSIGMGNADSVTRRSPTSVVAHVFFANSERAWLRYGVTLRAEVESKVTFGFSPQVAVGRSWRWLSYGAVAGVPLIIAPKSLYGIEVGLYASFDVIEWLSVLVQGFGQFYLLGNDLPEDSFLVMVQLYAGVEIHF